MNVRGTTGRRGVWLTVFLLYAAFSNAWGAYRAIAVYRDLVSHRDPNLPHWPFLVLAILSGLAVAAIVGLWRLRVWGLILYLICWGAALGIGIFLNVPFSTHLWSLLNVGLLLFFVVPKWEALR